MGVLQRSPGCIAVFNQNQFLLEDFEHALPDFRPEDNVGSVFSDQRYLACAGVPGGPTTRASRILAPWCWEQGDDRAIVVVNLTGAPAQVRVHLPWSDLQDNAWRLRDWMSDAVYARDSVDMSQQGLYGGPRCHLFRCSHAAAVAEASAGLMSLAQVEWPNLSAESD